VRYLLPLPLSYSEACLAVFVQTNEHLRNAEQKQLTVTGAYLGMVALVLSILPARAVTILSPRAESASIYGVMAAVGCCVFLIQAWCRVWKEHYLDIACRIAQTWSLPDRMLPFWLRVIPEWPRRGVFKVLNIDNTLVYLTFVLNTLLVALVCHQLALLLQPGHAYALILGTCGVYGCFLFGVERLIENRRGILRA